MPKIPEYHSTKIVEPGSAPRIPEGTSGAVFSALGQAGRQISNLGDDAFRLAELEQNADRTLKSGKLDIALREDADIFAERLRTDQDYTNMEKNTKAWLDETHSRLSKMAEDDPVLQQHFEEAFSKHQSNLTNLSRDKRYTLMTETAKGDIEKLFNQSLVDYSNERDPTKREIIKNAFEIKTRQYQQNSLITPRAAEVVIDNFLNKAESVRADQEIERNPYDAEKMLRANEFDMDPNLKQDKIEKAITEQKHAEVMARISRNEAEAKQKEFEQEAHDEEERNIGLLFAQKDYAKAYDAVVNSKYLKGDEIRILSTAINSATEGAAKEKKPESDPVVKSDFKSEINQRPEDFDVKKLWEAVGDKTLTADDAQTMQETLEKRKADTPKAQRMKRATEMLEQFRKDKVLGDMTEGISNEEFNKSNEVAFQRNLDMLEAVPPGEDPIKWIEDNVKLIKAKAEESFLDKILKRMPRTVGSKKEETK
jgi:hypothetical protein